MVTAELDYRTKIVKSLGQLPPFSPVLNKLLATLAREDVAYSELAGIIEKDTVMSGNVLRLVNSAAYARRSEINSIPHAISVLGINKLRNVVLGLSISRMWSGVKTPKIWSPARFNLHSIAVAVMADNLAQHLSVNYPEGAFVSGLMHDFGKLLMAVALPAEYEQVDQLKKATGRDLTDCEREVIGGDHADCSAIALEEWNLPSQIRRAVAFHHRPTENPSFETEKEGATFHLAELVSAADNAVNHLGVTVHEIPAGTPKHEHPTEPIQRMTDEETTWKLMGDFEREFEAIRKFF